MCSYDEVPYVFFKLVIYYPLFDLLAIVHFCYCCLLVVITTINSSKYNLLFNRS